MTPKHPRQTLTLDVEKYQAMLDAPDISPDQQKAFLEAMWQVVVGFVDLGFSVAPSEPCKESCGQLPAPSLSEKMRAAAMVKSDITLQEAAHDRTRSIKK